MRIRRDYNEPFFRRRRKNRHPVRNFLLVLFLLGAMGYFVSRQPDRIVDLALQVLGPEMTPTPLPGALAAQAQDLFWAGELDDALEIMTRVVGMQPDRVDYLYEYGMLLIDLDNGRNDLALQALETAGDIIQLDPNDPRGYALRARALVWTGNSAGAIPVARAGLDISPEFAPLHAALSRAYIGQGQLAEGQNQGLLAIEYGPGDVRSYWAYASSLAYSGARDEAILEYERTTDVHPAFLPPYFELALLYLASNRDQEAIDTYDRILGVQPRNPRALLRQCEAYRKVGQFERALGLCQDSVASDPDFVPAQYRYGLLLYNEFDFEGARAAFQACVTLESGNLECTYRLGLTYYYLAQDSYRADCAEQRSLECPATEICQTGWSLLEDALLMAQARTDTDEDVEIIREGLSAMSGDVACNGITGRPFPTFTPPPESTEEAAGS